MECNIRVLIFFLLQWLFLPGRNLYYVYIPYYKGMYKGLSFHLWTRGFGPHRSVVGLPFFFSISSKGLRRLDNGCLKNAWGSEILRVQADLTARIPRGFRHSWWKEPHTFSWDVFIFVEYQLGSLVFLSISAMNLRKHHPHESGMKPFHYGHTPEISQRYRCPKWSHSNGNTFSKSTLSVSIIFKFLVCNDDWNYFGWIRTTDVTVLDQALKRRTIPQHWRELQIATEKFTQNSQQKTHSWKLKIKDKTTVFLFSNSNSANFVSAQSFSCPIFFSRWKATKVSAKKSFPPRFFC